MLSLDRSIGLRPEPRGEFYLDPQGVLEAPPDLANESVPIIRGRLSWQGEHGQPVGEEGSAATL